MRRRLILALIAAAAAAPAFASEEKKDEPVAQWVDIATVGLPIVWKGRVVNYIFTSVRVNLQPRVNAVAMRAKEPFFRDALIRAAHRTPFTLATDYAKIDEAALKRVMTAEAIKIAGAGSVVSIEVRNQMPQRRSGLPKP